MTHPKGKLVHEMAAAIRDKSLSKALPFDHKKGPILCTERVTCALPDGLPSFFKRWQRYDKIPKPPNDFGIFCANLDFIQNTIIPVCARRATSDSGYSQASVPVPFFCFVKKCPRCHPSGALAHGQEPLLLNLHSDRQ